MYAVEFHAKVKEDGRIDIPATYRSQLQGTVRVIILIERLFNKPSIIRQLLENPRSVESSAPFKRDDLYDRSL